jgi:flagellar biosynthesis/type III secretory pathway chaperone
VETKQSKEHLKSIQESLQSIMNTEISIMREVLGNMLDEQGAILHNNTEALKLVLSDREPRIFRMNEAREQRIEIVKELSKSLGGEVSHDGQMGKQIDLENILNQADSDSIEILYLRDQIVALLEKMNTQNTRNSYLLENRVAFHKEFMRRLQPEEKNPTYDVQGDYKKKQKIAAVTIINREG